MSDSEGSEMSVEEAPVPRRRKKSPEFTPPGLNMDSLHLIADFTRPKPVKEDLVIYKKKDGVGLAYVYKIKNLVLAEEKFYKDLSGATCRLELVPSCKRVVRATEEVLVIDRSFNVGETVIPFENEFLGQEKENQLWMKMDKQLGLVTECKMYADILAVPSKHLVLKDYPIDNEPEFVEMFGYHLTHNYIMYEQWIGDVRECIHLVTCSYRNHKVVIREAGDSRDGVYLRRAKADDTKAFVPGEKVSLTFAEASSKFVEWSGGLPPSLSLKGKCRRVKKQMAERWLHLVVEKVETYEMEVEWITSPSDPLNQPPNRIGKENMHKVAHLDTFVNPRVSSTDRIVVYPKEDDTFITKTEYMEELAQKYAGSFKKWVEAAGDEDQPRQNGPSPKMAKSEENDVEMEKPSEGEEEAEFSDGSEEGEVVNKRKRKKTRRRNPSPPSIPPERNARALFGDKFYGEVLATRSLISIKWMDGTVERDIPSHFLVPVDPDLDQQDHLPGTIINRKGEALSDLTFGIILSTNTTERSCRVRWFKRENLEEPLEFHKDEEMTLFDVMPHGIYRRCFMGYHGVELDKDTTELREISYQVVADLDNGKQRVRYLDGRTAELWPDEITTLQFEDSVMESESSDEEGGWEPHTDEMNDPDANGRTLEVRDKMAPPEFCSRLMELLDNPSQDSLFQAMGMMVVAYPFKWDNPRQVLLDFGEQGFSDRNGEYWEAEGKHIWNHSHPMIEDAARFLKLSKIIGFKNPPTESGNLYFTEDQKMREPGIVAEILSLAEKHPQLPRLCRVVNGSVDPFIRMANMANFSKIAQEDVLTNRLLFIFGFEDENLSVNQMLHEAEPNMVIQEVICMQTRTENASATDPKYVCLVNVCCPENARKACEHLNGSLRDGEITYVLSLQEWNYFMTLIVFWKTTYAGGGEWLTVDREKWLSWGFGEGHNLKLKDLRDQWSDGDMRSLFLGEREFRRTNFFNDQIQDLLKFRPAEEVSSIRLVVSPGEMPSPFLILAQIVSCGSFPNTVYTDRAKVALDEKEMIFVEALLWLWEQGVLSGPYVDYGEILQEHHIAFSRRRKGFVGKGMTLELQQECLSAVIDGRYFPLWQRLNRITSNGMSLSHIYKSIRTCLEGSPADETTIVSFSDLSRRVRTAPTASLKTELDNWCTLLGVTKEEEQEGKAEKEEVDGIAKFEVLDEHSPSHSFAKRASASGRKFFQAVQKEHKALSLHLPDGIYVRAFDDRLDLLSVVIVGPCGTPFEAVPFIFDIFIPETYPQVPPEVYYVAYSQEQLNPNLYQQGKVCTSLLGTWSGEGQENWNPSSSNILQVLISIQGLILVPEPYFNEAGYEVRKADPATKSCSQRYNETATINALDYLYTVMANPPSDRKDIVQKQISRAWPQLRELLQSWCQEVTEPQFPVVNSKGFRMALAKEGERIDKLMEKFSQKREQELQEEEPKKAKKRDSEETDENLSRTFILLAKEEDRQEAKTEE